MFDYRLPSLSHSRLAHELTREEWERVKVGDLIAFRDQDNASLPSSKRLVLRNQDRDMDGNTWEICEVYSIPIQQRGVQ